MTRYTPDPESLAAHVAPAWFRDAKLGVMITWGLFSVPAFAPKLGLITELLKSRYDDALSVTPYAEWYENSMKFAGGPTAAHHAVRWAGRDYAAFRADFEAAHAGWSAAPWAELFAAAGARYVVPITRHADSYALWPSAVENPFRPNWRSPRDLIGEIAAAVRAKGLRFGAYYCAGQDWTFAPQAVKNIGEMIAAVPMDEAYRAYVKAHYAELIEHYAPDLLWNDIGYPNADDLWVLLADYLNQTPEGAVNDRFQPAGPINAALADPVVLAQFNTALKAQLADPALAFAPGEPQVYDYRTPEYAAFSEAAEKPWECVRGIGGSFGCKANETAEDRLTGADLVRLLADVVSKNGNLLINVGPTAEGEIIAPERAALETLGAWLKTNGAAIYKTRPWRRAEGETARGEPVRFTQNGEDLFAIVLAPLPPGPVVLRGLSAPGEAPQALGAGPCAYRHEGPNLAIDTPAGFEAAPAVAFRIPAGARA